MLVLSHVLRRRHDLFDNLEVFAHVLVCVRLQLGRCVGTKQHQAQHRRQAHVQQRDLAARAPTAADAAGPYAPAAMASEAAVLQL